ncbi:MAG: 50S ribosomal protein L24 [Hyphomonadaceae bacterium]
MAAKIKKGDTVIVLAGKDKGRSGKVLQVIPAADRVVVENINVHARHAKASMSDPQGGIKRTEAPLHISNVALRDPSTGKPTRVGFKMDEKRGKVRVARRSGVEIDV